MQTIVAARLLQTLPGSKIWFNLRDMWFLNLRRVYGTGTAV
ncbi:MAG: hypothetical protein WAO58_05090 [Fimbriimonadaceae bacterium]